MDSKRLTYEQALKLPLHTKIFSESKRNHYIIVYNLWKLIVKRVGFNNKLESPIEVPVSDINDNFYHISTNQ